MEKFKKKQYLIEYNYIIDKYFSDFQVLTKQNNNIKEYVYEFLLNDLEEKNYVSLVLKYYQIYDENSLLFDELKDKIFSDKLVSIINKNDLKKEIEIKKYENNLCTICIDDSTTLKSLDIDNHLSLIDVSSSLIDDDMQMVKKLFK